MPPFIHYISVDFPSRVDELSKSSDCFNVALLKEELCYDYRSKPPKSLLDDSVELIRKQHPVNDLIEAADERHGPLMFELVLRCATSASPPLEWVANNWVENPEPLRTAMGHYT